MVIRVSQALILDGFYFYKILYCLVIRCLNSLSRFSDKYLLFKKHSFERKKKLELCLNNI